MEKNFLNCHDFKNKDDTSNSNQKSTIFTVFFFTLVCQNVERKVKNSEHSKLKHLKKLDREKALHFKADINSTPLNY